jgi:predicted nucleic acid-binding protein
MSTASLDVAWLVASGVPVLCLDTCTVLDVMRDPTRESVRAHEQQAALDLLSAMEAGTDLEGLIAEQVRFEFDANAKAVEEEAVRALRKLRDDITRVDAVAAVFGAVGQADLRHLDDHVARSRAVVDRWMAAVKLVPQGAEIASRALLRVNQVRTPARKGRDSMKDCVVIETYLDAITAARAAGLTSKVVFVSSNTKDYAGEIGTALKQDLAQEFANIGIEYAPNLAAAKHLLGL